MHLHVITFWRLIFQMNVIKYFQEVYDEKPPSIPEKSPAGCLKSANRNYRSTNNLLFGGVSGKGHLLNRGTILLYLYVSMGD